MKAFLFILVAICILLALTAFRYRKGIMAVIRVSRMVKQASLQGRRESHLAEVKTKTSSPLVRCSRCGTWVPKDRARTIGSGSYFCSTECIESRVR